MVRYENIVFIGLYLILVYVERLISRVCYFFSYFGVSINCRSWILQVTQHISDIGGNLGSIYVWGLLALS